MSGWDDVRISQLKKLWAKGLSAGQIAASFGGIFTRSAIIGKVHRLGLPPRKGLSGKPAVKVTRLRKRNNFNVFPAKLPRAVEPTRVEKVAALITAYEDKIMPGDKARMSLVDLDKDPGVKNCRWPVGDPRSKDFGFCAEPVASGLPYCPHHCVRAYQTPDVRRRQAAPKVPAKQLEKSEA